MSRGISMMSRGGFSQSRDKMAPPESAPLIDNTALAQPILMKIDEPFSVTVQISGVPRPSVRWQVGRKLVKDSSKYKIQTDGHQSYSLFITKVTDELEKGVWVVATNNAGEDSCKLDVKTYKLFSGSRRSTPENEFQQKTAAVDNRRQPRAKLHSYHDTQSVNDMSFEEWQREMDIRNMMRSVDDLHLLETMSIDGRSSRGTGSAKPRLNESFTAGVTSTLPSSQRRRTSRGMRRKLRSYASTDAVSCDTPSHSVPPISHSKPPSNSRGLSSSQTSARTSVSSMSSDNRENTLPDVVRSVSNPRRIRASSSQQALAPRNDEEVYQSNVVEKRNVKKKSLTGVSRSVSSSMVSIDKDESKMENIPAGSKHRVKAEVAKALQVEDFDEEPGLIRPRGVRAALAKPLPVEEFSEEPGLQKPRVKSATKVKALAPEDVAPVDEQVDIRQITADKEKLWSLFGLKLHVLCKDVLNGLFDEISINSPQMENDVTPKSRVSKRKSSSGVVQDEEINDTEYSPESRNSNPVQETDVLQDEIELQDNSLDDSNAYDAINPAPPQHPVAKKPPIAKKKRAPAVVENAAFEPASIAPVVKLVKKKRKKSTKRAAHSMNSSYESYYEEETVENSNVPNVEHELPCEQSVEMDITIQDERELENYENGASDVKPSSKMKKKGKKHGSGIIKCLVNNVFPDYEVDTEEYVEPAEADIASQLVQGDDNNYDYDAESLKNDERAAAEGTESECQADDIYWPPPPAFVTEVNANDDHLDNESTMCGPTRQSSKSKNRAKRSKSKGGASNVDKVELEQPEEVDIQIIDGSPDIMQDVDINQNNPETISDVTHKRKTGKSKRLKKLMNDSRTDENSFSPEEIDNIAAQLEENYYAEEIDVRCKPSKRVSPRSKSYRGEENVKDLQSIALTEPLNTFNADVEEVSPASIKMSKKSKKTGKPDEENNEIVESSFDSVAQGKRSSKYSTDDRKLLDSAADIDRENNCEENYVEKLEEMNLPMMDDSIPELDCDQRNGIISEENEINEQEEDEEGEEDAVEEEEAEEDWQRNGQENHNDDDDEEIEQEDDGNEEYSNQKVLSQEATDEDVGSQEQNEEEEQEEDDEEEEEEEDEARVAVQLRKHNQQQWQQPQQESEDSGEDENVDEVRVVQGNRLSNLATQEVDESEDDEDDYREYQLKQPKQYKQEHVGSEESEDSSDHLSDKSETQLPSPDLVTEAAKLSDPTSPNDHSDCAPELPKTLPPMDIKPEINDLLRDKRESVTSRLDTQRSHSESDHDKNNSDISVLPRPTSWSYKKDVRASLPKPINELPVLPLPKSLQNPLILPRTPPKRNILSFEITPLDISVVDGKKDAGDGIGKEFPNSASMPANISEINKIQIPAVFRQAQSNAGMAVPFESKLPARGQQLSRPATAPKPIRNIQSYYKNDKDSVKVANAVVGSPTLLTGSLSQKPVDHDGERKVNSVRKEPFISSPHAEPFPRPKVEEQKLKPTLRDFNRISKDSDTIEPKSPTFANSLRKSSESTGSPSFGSTTPEPISAKIQKELLSSLPSETQRPVINLQDYNRDKDMFGLVSPPTAMSASLSSRSQPSLRSATTAKEGDEKIQSINGVDKFQGSDNSRVSDRSSTFASSDDQAASAMEEYSVSVEVQPVVQAQDMSTQTDFDPLETDLYTLSGLGLGSSQSVTAGQSDTYKDTPPNFGEFNSPASSDDYGVLEQKTFVNGGEENNMPIEAVLEEKPGFTSERMESFSMVTVHDYGEIISCSVPEAPEPPVVPDVRGITADGATRNITVFDSNSLQQMRSAHVQSILAKYKVAPSAVASPILYGGDPKSPHHATDLNLDHYAAVIARDPTFAANANRP